MLKAFKSWPLVAAIALLANSALAQEETQLYPECEGEPSDAAVKAAKGAFQAGQVAFEEGDYARAITYWEDAYRRDCTAHAMLLNLARVYELAERKQQAVVALETYLARDPESKKRDQISRRIEVLREKIGQEERPQPQPEPEPVPDAEPTTAPPPPPVEVHPQPESEAQSGGQRPILPLVVAIGGGVIAATGGVLYVIAAGDVSHWEDVCGGRGECPTDSDRDEANAARDRQMLWGTVSIAGLAIGAGGLVWYLLSPPKSDQSASLVQAKHTKAQHGPVVLPALSPDYAGLSLRGAF